ncbi:GCS-domain-containing protein [Neoconidiobolus thromboides FSU 785]|nr:GCS-domain-containing protein [Neoconidiobolus thromboides FSU 785]
MGLLTLGTPLSWEDSQPYISIVKSRGISQFLSIYKNNKLRSDDPLLWGDEIEYLTIEYNHEKKIVYLATITDQIIPKLQKEEEIGLKEGSEFSACWRSEFGKFQIEGTPGKPYNFTLYGLLQVESNMKIRRKLILELLNQQQSVITLPLFFNLGNNECKVFDQKYNCEENLFLKSNSLSDEVIYPHPRYQCMSRNLRLRCNNQTTFNIPIYKDIYTDKSLLYNNDNDNNNNNSSNKINFDSSGFGAACCCLQTTFQCPNFNEACFLYDCLIPIAPIMLALSANTPVMKGYLSSLDTRYEVLKYTNDGRNEMDKLECQKSRYDGCSYYLSQEPEIERFNDIKVKLNNNTINLLNQSDINRNLKCHLSNIFSYDPMIIFKDQLNFYNKNELNYFDSIYSTVWQTVRFKPPTSSSDIGWRVEFRPMEVQITDFENAAYSIFLNLLVKAILKYKPNYYIPISKVDQNIINSNKINAINQQYFLFNNKYNQINKFTINQLINGDSNNLIEGFIPLINRYLLEENIDLNLNIKLQAYLNFISDRASGKLLTGASFIRQLIFNHPDYKFDSKLNETINYDLIQIIDKLGQYRYDLAPQLLGKYYIHTNN